MPPEQTMKTVKNSTLCCKFANIDTTVCEWTRQIVLILKYEDIVAISYTFFSNRFCLHKIPPCISSIGVVVTTFLLPKKRITIFVVNNISPTFVLWITCFYLLTLTIVTVLYPFCFYSSIHYHSLTVCGRVRALALVLNERLCGQTNDFCN